MSAATAYAIAAPNPYRRPTIQDLWRLLSQRANNRGEVSVSGEDLAKALHVYNRMTIWRWLGVLILQGRVAKIGFNGHTRLYRILKPPTKPPGSVTSVTLPQVLSFVSVTEIKNIESIERARACPPPEDQQREQPPKDGVWTAFQEWVFEQSGQRLPDIALGVICRELKRCGKRLQDLWQALVDQRHHLQQARDIGKVLWSVVKNGLRRPWRTPQATPRPQTTKPSSKATATPEPLRPPPCFACYGIGRTKQGPCPECTPHV